MNSLIKSFVALTDFFTTNFQRPQDGKITPYINVERLGKFTTSINYFSNSSMNIYNVYLEDNGDLAYITKSIVCFSKSKINDIRISTFDDYSLRTVPEGLLLKKYNEDIITIPYPVTDDNRFIISTYIPEEMVDLFDIDFSFIMNFKLYEKYHKDLESYLNF